MSLVDNGLHRGGLNHNDAQVWYKKIMGQHNLKVFVNLNITYILVIKIRSLNMGYDIKSK